MVQSRTIYFLHFNSLESTQLYAKSHIPSFAKDSISVVWADRQTKGIGTRGKKWVSDDENLYTTFVFFISKSTDLTHIPKILISAVMKSLESLGIELLIKWPNDLMIEKKKVGGILTEIIHTQDEICCLLGLGLNVNMHKKTLSKIDQPATSIFEAMNKTISIETLLVDISHHLIDFLVAFETERLSEMMSLFKKKMVYLGYDVYHENQKIGKAIGISDDGLLEIVSSDQIKKIAYGSIKIHD